MRKLALCVIGLMLTAGPALAQMGGRGGMTTADVPQQSSDDEPRAANIGDYHATEYLKPISMERFDKTVAAMFARADVNHDGMVTLAELESVINANRNVAITARFHDVDTNHDGVVSLAEFTAWQQDMGSAAASQCAAYAAQIVPDTLGPVLANTDLDDALGDVILPLSALVITQANSHYRAGITLDDLLALEHKRFNVVDTNHDGYLEQSEVEALRRATRARGPARP